MLRRPRIHSKIRVHNFLALGSQNPEQSRYIECVANGRVRREILFGELKKAHGWLQTPAMFRMRWLLEMLLQMNEGAGGLNQPFEVICVARTGLEPKLFENVVRFVVTLFIPAAEKCAIKWLLVQRQRLWIDIFLSKLAHEARNPLAFVHGGLNLSAAPMMGKRARFTFPEGSPESIRGRRSAE